VDADAGVGAAGDDLGADAADLEVVAREVALGEGHVRDRQLQVGAASMPLRLKRVLGEADTRSARPGDALPLLGVTTTSSMTFALPVVGLLLRIRRRGEAEDGRQRRAHGEPIPQTQALRHSLPSRTRRRLSRPYHVD
jgi:hypothetical protein